MYIECEYLYKAFYFSSFLFFVSLSNKVMLMARHFIFADKANRDWNIIYWVGYVRDYGV